MRSNLSMVGNPKCPISDHYTRNSRMSYNQDCAENASQLNRSGKKLRIRRSALSLTASDQRQFGEPQGIKRWIKMKLKPRGKKGVFATEKYDNSIPENSLNFPVWPEQNKCEALIITLNTSESR